MERQSVFQQLLPELVIKLSLTYNVWLVDNYFLGSKAEIAE